MRGSFLCMSVYFPASAGILAFKLWLGVKGFAFLRHKLGIIFWIHGKWKRMLLPRSFTGIKILKSWACLGTLAQFYFVDGVIHMVSLAAVQNKKQI